MPVTTQDVLRWLSDSQKVIGENQQRTAIMAQHQAAGAGNRNHSCAGR